MAPSKFLDPHHHYYNPPANAFQSFLNSLGLPPYLPKDYRRDVIGNLKSNGISLIGSIHVEALPDDGVEEVKWLLKLKEEDENCQNTTQAIVASVDISKDDCNDKIAQVAATTPLVKGIRWILDYNGPFDDKNPNCATHPATTRMHPQGLDCLDKETPIYKNVDKGFASLAKHDLSFDLQCAPEQFQAALELFQQHPNVPVVIDHLGKPRSKDEAAMALWREGLQKLALLPNVYIKLSLLGCAVPGWFSQPEEEAVLRGLVREVVAWFGVERCMIATNWHLNASISDSDGRVPTGPTPAELLSKIATWLEKDETDLEWLYFRTAAKFYRVSLADA